MKFNKEYKTRFRILKGGKISLVVSALLVGSLVNTAQATEYLIENNTSAQSISLSEDSNITVVGDLNVTASNIVKSLDIVTNGHIGNVDVVSSGSITAATTTDNTSVSFAGGIVTDSLANSSITNSGSISASAPATGEYAFGIRTDSLTNSSITNSGSISASAPATGKYAFGIGTGSLTNSSITNSGSISASVDGDVDVDYSISIGISASNLTNSSITNSGTITAKLNNALDRNGFAIIVDDSDSSSTITNTETGKLYGNLYIEGDAEVINKGLIALPYNANIINYVSPEGITLRAASSIPANAYIRGNLTNTGTIQIAMLTDGNISTTQYSQLRVGGNAIFNPGSILDVNVLAASTNTNLLIGETLEDVVSAGDLTVNELNVTDNSSLLDFEYILDGNSIDLNIVNGSENGSVMTILESTIQGGGNSNARSAAKVLDDIQYEGIPSDMENFYGKLNTLGTDEEIAKAVDSTVSYAGVSNIGASNAILDNFFGILEKQGQGGLNLEDKLFIEKRVWIKPFGNFGKQKDKDNIHGFDFSVRGIGIGAEGEYSDNAYAGIGFFYNRADVNVNGIDQSSDLDNYSALIYGRTPIANGKANFRYKASASWQKTDSERYIALTNETAKANYTSNMYAIDLRVEKDMKTYNNLLLEPIIGATYKYIHTPSYKENGSGTDLSVDSSNTEKLTTYLGAKAYYPLDETSTLYGKINVGYDVIDDDISIVSAYSASPNNKFTTNGIDNGRWNYSAAIGYKKHISNQDDINFRYEYSGEGNSYYNNTFFLNYSHKF